MKSRCLFCGTPTRAFGPYQNAEDTPICETCSEAPRTAEIALRQQAARLGIVVVAIVAVIALAFWVFA